MYLFWENIWFNLCKISVLKGSKCSYSSLILKYVNYGALTKQPNITAICWWLFYRDCFDSRLMGLFHRITVSYTALLIVQHYVVSMLSRLTALFVNV